MRVKVALLTCVFVSMFALSAFAAIDVSNRTGTISIGMPDGTVVTVTAGQPLPAIPDGATITIVSGTASVATTGDSTVSVSIGSSTVQLGTGTTANFGLDPVDGSATVTLVSGQATAINGDTSAALDSGDSIKLFYDLNDRTCTIELLAGTVPVTLSDGSVVTLDPEHPRMQCKLTAEPYTPPALPDTSNIRPEITGDEGSRDISNAQ